MTKDNFSTTFTVPQPPRAAYQAIVKPSSWWSGEHEGEADRLGGIFTYRYKTFHYSRQEVTELVEGRRVAWRVLESNLSFLEDKSEWTGTVMTFDIVPEGELTRVTFTHVGLRPQVECYDTCADAWTSLIQGSLKQLIESGETELIELAAPAA